MKTENNISELLDRPRVIALCGPMGVGKSTLAKAIAAQLTEYDSIIALSFAEPIKKALLTIAGLPLDNWQELFQELKEKEFLNTGRIWRYAAQTLGTEWGRDIIHPDIWSKAAAAKIRQYEGGIIDDLRFHSESNALHKKFDVLTIRLHRTEITESKESHLSEQEYKTMPKVTVDWFVPETTTATYTRIVMTFAAYLKRDTNSFNLFTGIS